MTRGKWNERLSADTHCVPLRQDRHADGHYSQQLQIHGGALTMQETPALSIERAYRADEAAAILGISTRTLNDRVRQGYIQPIFQAGERRYSGFAIARLLGWPLTDDPRDYMPSSEAYREELPRLILDMLLAGQSHFTE